MSEVLAVVVQGRAAREIEIINAWWHEHRTSAPGLFASELETMLAALALVPTLGVIARDVRLSGVRRVLLTRSRYHLYYRVSGTTVEVLAIWHARRGAGPRV